MKIYLQIHYYYTRLFIFFMPWLEAAPANKNRILYIVISSVVTSHQQVESHVESTHPKVESFHFLVESSQWLHSSRVNGYTNCVVNKNALKNSLQVETCLSASRITLYFFKPFQDPSQPIQLQYFLWIYPEQVDSSHLRQKSTGRVRVKSFGAVDSSHLARELLGRGCWLESFGQGVIWPGLLTRVKSFFVWLDSLQQWLFLTYMFSPRAKIAFRQFSHLKRDNCSIIYDVSH
jgi:hypothetical protein